MIIAIDESGAFGTGSPDRSFFVAVHLRQRKTIYKHKQQQFIAWEKSLPRSLKNAKGEIKSSLLSDEQLADFSRNVIRSHHHIGITPMTIHPSKNPESVIEKHRQVALYCVLEGKKEYFKVGKPRMAKLYEEFGGWLKKLSYSQYLKLLLLGECIVIAIGNTIGHAITGKYDDELPRMRLLIDQDFIREKHANYYFWQEILRNQLYEISKTDPLPLLKKWRTKGHPFLEKYAPNGRLNLAELFRENCLFAPSHLHFEIRMADAVNTIIFRYFNRRQCRAAYALIRPCFLRDGRIHEIILNDFNLADWRYNPDANPWRKLHDRA